MKTNVRIGGGVSESRDMKTRTGLTGRSNRVKRAELFVKGSPTTGHDEQHEERSFNFRISRN